MEHGKSRKPPSPHPRLGNWFFFKHQRYCNNWDWNIYDIAFTCLCCQNRTLAISFRIRSMFSTLCIQAISFTATILAKKSWPQREVCVCFFLTKFFYWFGSLLQQFFFFHLLLHQFWILIFNFWSPKTEYPGYNIFIVEAFKIELLLLTSWKVSPFLWMSFPFIFNIFCYL